MFNRNILEDIKTETIAVNGTHWLLKTDIYVKCFGSILNAKIKLTLNTKNNILSKEQECCNNICIQNEIHTYINLYIPMVMYIFILYSIFIIIYGVLIYILTFGYRIVLFILIYYRR